MSQAAPTLATAAPAVAVSTPRKTSVQVLTLAAAVVLLLAIYLLPSPAPLERAGGVIPLTPKGQACLAIMAFAVLLWVTETVPFAVTSLLVVLLIPLFQLADFRTVVRAGFGDPIVAFFIGVLMLSAAFTRSGLGTRLVYHILERVGTRTDRVLLGVLAVGTFISWWITDMAVAAMLLPLAVGLLRDAKLTPGSSNFGRALMISTAFGPLIGGIATPAGTAANLVAIAQIKQLANVDISFTRWMIYGAPAAILMVPLCWRLLLWLFPPEIDRLPFSADDVRERLRGLGSLSRAELWTLATFSTVIAVWLATPVVSAWTQGAVNPPVEAVALAGGLVLFLPGIRVMSWKEAERDIEWGGIMLIVAGLSLGLVVFESGAARWLAWVLLGQITLVPDLLRPVVIVLAVAGLHLLFSSNTVTASIIVPILVALATDLHLDVWSVVAPAAFTSSLAFILVSEGPTTIIPYSSGYFSIKDMARAGLLMTVVAALCVAASVEASRLAGCEGDALHRRGGASVSATVTLVNLEVPLVPTAGVRRALIARDECALLDVREESAYAAAHPLFAASLPIGRIEAEVLDRVPRLSTPIVVYDAGEGLAEQAVKTLRVVGYTRVSRLAGGLDGWRHNGGELFRDVNSASKAFGELVEATRHTPSIGALELKSLLDAHADVVVLDARREDEFRTMSIPGGVSTPGAELVWRTSAAAPRPETLVVVNCAGRTRSIIGAQSLVNAGIRSRVSALRNGTIGWALEGLALAHGQTGRVPEPGAEAGADAARAARAVADRAGVRRLSIEGLQAFLSDRQRTAYRFDVRSPSEYEASHVQGFRNAPGGQLVQETDVFAPVRGARIVLWDPAGARADMTASWLAQMNWEVYVLDASASELPQESGAWRPNRPALPPVVFAAPAAVATALARERVLILDFAPSPQYRRSHIAGAWFVSAPRLRESVVRWPNADRVVVTSPDGVIAAYVAPGLAGLVGVPVNVLSGGTAAWQAAGLPMREGLEHLSSDVTDVYKRPYEGTDNATAAMQAYLEWEYGLVAQLERDGTHGFTVL